MSLFSDKTSSNSILSFKDLESEAVLSDEVSRRDIKDIPEQMQLITRCINAAQQCTIDKDKEGAVSAWNDVVTICKASGDGARLIWAYAHMGEIYMHFNDIRNAIRQYEIEKNLAEQHQLYELKMQAYRRLGKCHQLLRNYKEALICFKKMLELAWETNSLKDELLAYDFIAMQYFYLGDVERSAYYHDRMSAGKYEAKNSPSRALAKATLAQRRKNRLAMPSESAKDKSSISASGGGKYRGERNFLNASFVELTELPSPRASSGFSKTVRIMPFTIPPEEQREVRRTEHTSSMPSLRRMPTVRSTAKTQRQAPGVKPFVLLSHLSPNRSINNLYYFAQMNSRLPKRE
jgi:tetratricopeptide (TPR) repeat protein